MRPQIHEVLINPNYLSLIKERKKTIEGRVNKHPYSQIEKGHQIKFIDSKNPVNTLLCTVVEKAVYSSFKALLTAEGLNRCLPGIQTLEEGVAIYHSFPNYQKDAFTHQVIAFKIDQDPQ